MNRWEQGRATIDQMIVDRALQHVKPDRALAEATLEHARAHVAAAHKIIDDDAVGSLNLAYDAARKGFSAVLENQGLRVTVAGGHKAIEDAMRAQLVPPMTDLVAGYGWMRITRNASEYMTFDRAVASREDAAKALEYSAQIIEKAAKLVEVMPPY